MISTAVDNRLTVVANLITPLLTALLIGGVGWLLLEVQDSRERWARVEERIGAQSALIMEMRVELNDTMRENRAGLREMERNIYILERRVTLLEAANVHASQN